ncbi:hypothetical protein HKX42_03555 [Salinisphaera sp. USBA-960]|uniref:heme biosynthesis HemY N-terminal domain-containing protein n=1 Tax=Salinisphaera orenii TaxID=856731 RepID=UPI000DBE0EC3|nr:hypothetical protein [Salifodinibacter halophilus]NNC25954.1 hypothetical protein [Salifodinibacter halophilus]
MRRAVVTFCVFLLLGIAVAVIFHDQRGQLLITFGAWRIQTSLAFAVIALIVVSWLALVILRAIVSGVLLPARVSRGLAARRDTRQYTGLMDGLGRFTEQRWRAAETQLKRVDNKGALGAIARLGAACSAAYQGREAACAQYLDDARYAQSLSELAVELTTAELAVYAGRHADAVEHLRRLRATAPHHPRVLTLYAEQLHCTENYDELRGVLHDVEKYGELGDERALELSRAAWSAALTHNAKHAEDLISTWSRMPKRLQNDASMVEFYVERLRSVSADHEARRAVRNYLNHHWAAALARLYGQLAGDDIDTRLSDTEKWLRRYGNKPELLLVAGRLCLRAKLWGRARHYFEQSQELEARSDVLLELGSLYEQIGEPVNARAAYRKGLSLQVAD